MKHMILAATAVATCFAAGTTLPWPLPTTTKIDVASMAHCKNFHSLAGVRVSELLDGLREKGSTKLNRAGPLPSR